LTETVNLLLLQGGIGGLGGALLPMILIFGVFYLLLIRPQQKKQRDLQATIAQLKAGDKVVTTGGVIGIITNVRETSFLIRSADKSILEIARSAVAAVDTEEKP
jgi:preprotein translocase subunit YajC